MSKELIEVTVIKNKDNVMMAVTKEAFTKQKRHFQTEGWTEATDEEKENYYKGKLVIKKKTVATPKSAKKTDAPVQTKKPEPSKEPK